MDLFEYFKTQFHIEAVSPKSYSPLALAYIGDSIFDVMVRTIIVSDRNKPVNKYHSEASKIVCAKAQAKMILSIEDKLSEEEYAVYKRGRNAHTNSKAKNASRADYCKATGFEALLGYLYLKEDFERLTDLVGMAIASLEENEANV